MIPQKIRGNAFVFLPWLAFWSQGASNVLDLSKLDIAIAPKSGQCQQAPQRFRVTIARSGESRVKGLGGRTTPLKPDEGMLFIFDSPVEVQFWMKDTLIPLQIAFFDKKGTLTNSFEMPVEKDPSNPEQRYGSKGQIITVLEVAPNALKQLKPGQSTLCVATVPLSQ